MGRKKVKEQEETQGYCYITFNRTKECVNIDAFHSCYMCNACGRLNKETQKHDYLKILKEQLENQKSFDGWAAGFEELQRKNKAANIKWYEDKIVEVENSIKEIPNETKKL